MSGLRMGLATFAVLAITALAPQLAVAAPTPSGSIEESTGSVLDNVGVGLFGWTKGNGFGRWDGRQIKEDGTAGDPIEIMNQISVTYPTNVGLDFIVMPQFAVRPFLSTADKGAFELKDPTIGLVGTVYQSGGFSWWARFDNALPLSTGSRRDGLVLKPGSVNSVAYRFPRSGWEVQAVIVPEVSLMSSGEVKGFVYGSPRLNYIFSPSLTVFGILETAFETTSKTGLFDFKPSGSTNVGAGVKYSFADLYVQPFINVYPGGKVDGASTFIGMFFGGKLK